MIKKFLIITITFTSLFFINVNAQATTYFIDFKKVLNESKAGAEAQKILKKKLENEAKNLKNKKLN